MTAKEFSAAARKVGAEYWAMNPGIAKEFSAAARKVGAKYPGMTAEDSVLAPGAAGVYDEHDVAICPDVRAAGHNPRGLTVAQVGAGYRLLAREELTKGVRSPEDRLAIEMWNSGWSPNWNGNSVDCTYRTKKPPGFFLPAEAWRKVEEAWRKAEEALGKKTTTDAEAPPPPAGTKYVHTFVCNACPRTCTMETESAAPGPLVPGSFDMQCPFRRPEFVSLWKAGPVHTLTP